MKGDAIALAAADPAALATKICTYLTRQRRWSAIKEAFDALHRQVLAGEPAARESVAALMVPALRTDLHCWHSAAPEPDEVIHDIVVDAS